MEINLDFFIKDLSAFSLSFFNIVSRTRLACKSYLKRRLRLAVIVSTADQCNNVE